MKELRPSVVTTYRYQLLVGITHLYVFAIRPLRSLNPYLSSMNSITHILRA
jgi:hypothetical protein